MRIAVTVLLVSLLSSCRRSNGVEEMRLASRFVLRDVECTNVTKVVFSGGSHAVVLHQDRIPEFRNALRSTRVGNGEKKTNRPPNSKDFRIAGKLTIETQTSSVAILVRQGKGRADRYIEMQTSDPGGGSVGLGVYYDENHVLSSFLWPENVGTKWGRGISD